LVDDPIELRRRAKARLSRGVLNGETAVHRARGDPGCLVGADDWHKRRHQLRGALYVFVDYL
jgi:hypothetical protein